MFVALSVVTCDTEVVILLSTKDIYNIVELHLKTIPFFKSKTRKTNRSATHLTNGTVEASLYVVLAFIASVDKAVLTLVVQLHQHTHGAPHGPPEGTELEMFVPGQGKECIAAIHKVTCHKGVRVRDWGQGICHGASNQPNHKEHLGGGKQSTSSVKVSTQNSSYKILNHLLIHKRLGCCNILRRNV